MTDRPYPTVSAAEQLRDLPAAIFLEVAGRLHQISLDDGDDPIEVARRHMERRPWENRFRIVRLQRFSLAPDPHWANDVSPDGGPLCGDETTVDGAVVRCTLECHSEGIDHAGHIRLNGQPVAVHYWRPTPSPAP
ncbi:hypothetical protein ACFW08_05565 [Streptomyces sp. NPDC058960]|uniref:hypothetical protein n=1 Tax=Streptomyces sp. NPDC058960 TaxID=3346679 RepID=UPI00367D78A1